jgi:hypothetical protein
VIAAVVPAATSAQRASAARSSTASGLELRAHDVGIIYRERIDFTVWHAAAA